MGRKGDRGGLAADTSGIANRHDPVSMRRTIHKPVGNPGEPSILLLRSGGFGALLAGVLFATWGYVHSDDAPWYFDAIAGALNIVVPALFLMGLIGLFVLCKGLVGRIGKVGLVLGLAGSAMGIAYAVPWSAFATREDSLSLLVLDTVLVWWLHIILTGLPLLGISTVGTRTLRGLGILLLAMGASGWAYYITDSGAFLEARPAHVVLGLLFSLTWVVLGLALLRRGPHLSTESGALG